MTTNDERVEQRDEGEPAPVLLPDRNVLSTQAVAIAFAQRASAAEKAGVSRERNRALRAWAFLRQVLGVRFDPPLVDPVESPMTQGRWSIALWRIFEAGARFERDRIEVERRLQDEAKDAAARAGAERLPGEARRVLHHPEGAPRSDVEGRCRQCGVLSRPLLKMGNVQTCGHCTAEGEGLFEWTVEPRLFDETPGYGPAEEGGDDDDDDGS